MYTSKDIMHVDNECAPAGCFGLRVCNDFFGAVGFGCHCPWSPSLTPVATPPHGRTGTRSFDTVWTQWAQWRKGHLPYYKCPGICRNLMQSDACISLKLLAFCSHLVRFCSLKEPLLNSWVIWNGGTHVHRHRSRLLPKLYCRLFWGGLSSVLCLCPYLHACLVAPSLSRQAINFIHPHPQSRQLNAKFI